MFMDCEDTLLDSNSSYWMYKLKAIPMKIQKDYFVEIDKLISKLAYCYKWGYQL